MLIRTDNIGDAERLGFSKEIPFDYAEYKTYIPEYYVYNTKIKGFIIPKIDC